MTGHHINTCPEWSKPHPCATYFGSANQGLGFYHVDVPDMDENQWLNFRNCAVIIIVRNGEISLAELEQNLSDIFSQEWPWQIRQLDVNNFPVRFPPHKKFSETTQEIF